MQKIVLTILLFCILGAGLYWFTTRGGDKPELFTTKVVRMDLEESVLASGVVHAFNTIKVGAQVSGQLQRLHVDVGDSVSKGQLLAEIDPQRQRKALERAQAGLKHVRAQIQARQAQLTQYQLELARQQQMRGHDASAQADLEKAEAQVATTRAEIQALEAQMGQAQTEVDTAQVDLGYTRISAPIDGVVVDIETKEGQTIVSAQVVSTILTLAVLDTITVKAEISEADVTKVRPGQEVYFTILGNARRYNSTLRTIEPSPTTKVDDSTSASSADAIYYNGLFDLPNPDRALRIGMTAQASIVLARAANVLCVPVAALDSAMAGNKATVTVLRGEAPEQVTIHTGISDNVHIEVLDGLKDGDEIVVSDSSSKDLPVENVTRRRRGPGGPPPGGV